ncbi:MAG: Uncharacterised protein [Glaciecola sp. HTCC2999]|jgi:hypothetical protein|nr:MAG: Uncharacterised protein [Glaciecola sp. HTCC2999]
MALESLSQFTIVQNHPVFIMLNQVIPLTELTHWPDVRVLNDIVPGPYTYIDNPMPSTQEALRLSNLGYEGYIAETASIPTRKNWHDVFNACIWHQYPHSKQRLNQLHIEYIQQFGLHPRGNVRDNITHFDECGMLIVHAEGSRIPEMLQQHHWQDAFVNHRSVWGSEVQAFMFGHANLELLLAPHIGLTAKWVAIEVPMGFFKQDPVLQVRLLDALLVQRLERSFFKQKLPPIPYLGIPGWWNQQDESFYSNTDHFRPKRAHP